MMHTNEKKFGLVIHGGAGTIERSKMTPEGEREYRAGLERALAAGYEILKRGGSSLDATEAAVRVLEDDPHFNAGKGAVFALNALRRIAFKAEYEMAPITRSKAESARQIALPFGNIAYARNAALNARP